MGRNIQEIEVEGAAGGDDPGGKGGRCGWTEVVYEACFRVSLKHASLLWAEIFKKLRLKGLQMEKIQPFSAVDFNHTDCKKKVLLLGSRVYLVF